MVNRAVTERIRKLFSNSYVTLHFDALKNLRCAEPQSFKGSEMQIAYPKQGPDFCDNILGQSGDFVLLAGTLPMFPRLFLHFYMSESHPKFSPITFYILGKQNARSGGE